MFFFLSKKPLHFGICCRRRRRRHTRRGKRGEKAETAKRKHWKLPLSDLPVYVLLSQYVLLQEHARYIRVLLSCDQKDAFYLLVTQDLGGLGRTLPHIPYSQYLPVSLFSFTERETFRC